MNSLFEIDQDSGIVSVMGEIDREDLLDFGAVVTLTVKVTSLLTAQTYTTL